jgi:hypothetical protein
MLTVERDCIPPLSVSLDGEGEMGDADLKVASIFQENQRP